MPRGKFATVQTDKTEGYVNQILVPVVAHFMNDFKPLCKMQILVKCGQIDTLVKIVCFFAVKRGSNIPCGIKRASVFTDNQAGRHVLILQIHNHCAFAFLQQLFLLQFLHNRSHFIIIKTFAGICVKFNAKHIIDAFKFFYADVIKPFPEGKGFLVTILHFYKPKPCLIF